MSLILCALNRAEAGSYLIGGHCPAVEPGGGAPGGAIDVLVSADWIPL